MLFSAATHASTNGAVGVYVQDLNTTENPSDLYNPSKGFYFQGLNYYNKGDFYSYTWSGDQVSTIPAVLLRTDSNHNIQSLLGRNVSDLRLVNPAHEMKEEIFISSNHLSYYEPGAWSRCSSTLRLNVPKDTVYYRVYTGYIPAKRLTRDPASCNESDCYLDFEYRGKMTFLGDEYYVRDIDGVYTIFLDKGRLIENVSSEGFSEQFNGFRFKVNHLIYTGDIVSGVVLDVQKPDGTIVQTQVTQSSNSPAIDGLVEVAGVSAHENSTTAQASIILYDLTSEVVLQDGEDLEVQGKIYTDWEVYFELSDTCAGDGLCNLTEYGAMDADSVDALLMDVTVRYYHDLTANESLGVNQSLALPNGFMFKFRGYLDSNYRESCTGTQPVYAAYFLGDLEQDSCSLEGDEPPCGTVTVAEVLGLITKWAGGQASMGDVLSLITEWAQSG